MTILRCVLAIVLLVQLAACGTAAAPVEIVYGGTEHVCRCECPAPLTAVMGDEGYELKVAIVH